MREHPTDDLQARGALMVARAAAKPKGDGGTVFNPYTAMRDMTAEDTAKCRKILMSALTASTGVFDELMAVRRLAASDAALARAIDAVPAEPINGPRIARYFAETI